MFARMGTGTDTVVENGAETTASTVAAAARCGLNLFQRKVVWVSMVQGHKIRLRFETNVK